MKFFSMSDETLASCKRRTCSRFAAGALCLASVYCARALQTPNITHNTSHVRAQKKSSNTHQKDTAAANTTDTNQTQSIPPYTNSAVRPATVTLKDGILTVEANNSDLSQILKDVANASGMIINGPIMSARVFGIYGPSNPSDVLTDLLTGSGYNFMMLGATHEGAPRELLLTLQSSDSNHSPPSSRNVVDPDANSDMNAPDHDHLGPGAIIHTPPAPPQDDQQRVQQKLQRLEKMRDQFNQPQ